MWRPTAQGVRWGLNERGEAGGKVGIILIDLKSPEKEPKEVTRKKNTKSGGEFAKKNFQHIQREKRRR